MNDAFSLGWSQGAVALAAFGIIGKLPTFCNVSQWFSFQRYFCRLFQAPLSSFSSSAPPCPSRRRDQRTSSVEAPHPSTCREQTSGSSPSILSPCNTLFHFPPNWNQPAGHSAVHSDSGGQCPREILHRVLCVPVCHLPQPHAFSPPPWTVK